VLNLLQISPNELFALVAAISFAAGLKLYATVVDLIWSTRHRPDLAGNAPSIRKRNAGRDLARNHRYTDTLGDPSPHCAVPRRGT
jgi:hypothetical protein